MVPIQRRINIKLGGTHFFGPMRDWTFHGGRLRAAERTYPDAPRPWIDLSTGLNPIPYSAITSVDWTALPDEDALAELELAAAASFGLAEGRPCALPGTEIGIRLLGGIGLPAPFRHVVPTYGSHAAAFPQTLALSTNEAEAAARQGGTLLLANPNNPDGRLWPVETLLALATDLKRSGGALVIDEAFADATPAASIVPHLGSGSGNIIVLRSFGKFFGLGGLRLGFVLAPEPWRSAFRQRLGSWPVSAAAIAIGTAAYRDAVWIAASRERMILDAARLDRLLASHGLTGTGACPLFRLVESAQAAALFDTLIRHGILTRPFAYNVDWLRLGLPGNEDAWRRLDTALAASG